MRLSSFGRGNSAECGLTSGRQRLTYSLSMAYVTTIRRNFLQKLRPAPCDAQRRWSGEQVPNGESRIVFLMISKRSLANAMSFVPHQRKLWERNGGREMEISTITARLCPFPLFLGPFPRPAYTSPPAAHRIAPLIASLNVSSEGTSTWRTGSSQFLSFITCTINRPSSFKVGYQPTSSSRLLGNSIWAKSSRKKITCSPKAKSARSLSNTQKVT